MCAAALRFRGERDAHAPGRAVADEAHEVDRLTRSAGGHEHVLAAERPRAGEQLLDRAHDVLRLGHPPHAELALGRLAFVRPDECDAARAECLRVRTSRAVRPHARIHRRRDERRATMRERRFGEDVVGEAVRELCERVRRARRDDEEVGAREMEIHVVAGWPPSERAEGLGGDEALGAGRHERHDVVAAFDEQAADLARLVGGDAAGDSKQDPGHAGMMPAHAGPDRP